ncbi:hemerythrin domain-containing protein [uncultured Ornithinimicrobium sp.]|uniref:hemerythrin domain-containing protein n=1 Tax=uncultured Ornithinimicrobium sp. TaxID=259307 RepID=UPI0025915CDB|nr:hemerythrin domain-containing protein [uncultured Ornithinimicrobium sp.]
MAVHGAEEIQSHLQEVRARRAQMRESLTAVLDALAVPLGRPDVWRERARTALAELAHDFADHVDMAERPDGMFGVLLQDYPRLTGPVETLLGEHASLSEDLSAALATLDRDGPVEDLPALREELTALVGRFVRHRQRGSDLLWEAYAVDIGGQG